MTDWERITEELKKPLDPGAVKPPPKGKYGEYVESLHVIREANRIFGFEGWHYSVKELRQTNATKDPEGKHHIGYLAIVAVVVDGVTRIDVGHGQGHGKSEGDAHDSAVKEAVTDGMKRALRTFGNTFGLALYEKDKANREVGYSATGEEVQTAIEQINQCADLAALQSLWTGMSRNARHVAEDAKVTKAKDKRKAELQQKDAA